MGQLVFSYILREITKYNTMKLIQEIEQQRLKLLDEIAHIIELGFDPDKVFTSADHQRLVEQGERAGQARAGEREWMRQVAGEEPQGQQATPRERQKFTIKPEESKGMMVGDVVLHNEKYYRVNKWDAAKNAFLVGGNNIPVRQEQLSGPRLVDFQGKKTRVWMAVKPQPGPRDVAPAGQR